jgi:hypothetical protein
MTDTGGRSDEDFRARWSTDLGNARSNQEAAWLPSTLEAAQRAWARFSAGAIVLLTDSGRRTAAALRSGEQVIRDVAPAAGKFLLLTAQAAAVTYAEHLNERYRRSDEALRKRGWWALSSWDDQELEEFAHLARSLGHRDFSKEICRRYRSYSGRRLRRLVRRWEDEGAFNLRRPIIRDALTDHMARRYRVSIPTLMPCLEGVVADAIGLEQRRGVRYGLEPLGPLFGGLDALALTVALESLDTLYGWVDFSAASRLTPRLNRHLILHGRAVRYGTEANSLKVFLHLDEIHSQVVALRRLNESPDLRSDRSIRTANDLVKTLGVPDEMIAAARKMQPLLESRIDRP